MGKFAITGVAFLGLNSITSSGWSNSFVSVEYKAVTFARQQAAKNDYGGDGSGSTRDKIHKILHGIEQFNPVSQGWDAVSIAMFGIDKYGRSRNGIDMTYAAIGAIPFASFEGGAVQYSDDLVKAAQKLYPKKAGRTELHHIIPKYLGGAIDGPLVPLNGSYHQLITNEFRALWPYSKGAVPSASELQSIMKQVYSKYPLPPGY